jgi:hypothetical protein
MLSQFEVAMCDAGMRRDERLAGRWRRYEGGLHLMCAHAATVRSNQNSLIDRFRIQSTWVGCEIDPTDGGKR